MKEIKLSQGKVAIVDDEDFEKCNLFKWCAITRSNRNVFYAQRKQSANGKSESIYLHHCVLNCKSSQIIDHKNGNGLDNRKCNLRLCTKQYNSFNSPKRNNRNYSSAYKGVSYFKTRNNYVAKIVKDGKQHHLGYFSNPKDAALAYDLAAIKYFGEFARLNFQ